MAKNWKHNLTIWSHWKKVKLQIFCHKPAKRFLRKIAQNGYENIAQILRRSRETIFAK